MYEIYPSNWPPTVDSNDPRNQFHRTALHEARAVADRRETRDASPVREAEARSLLARLRLALAGGAGATTQACTDCPA